MLRGTRLLSPRRVPSCAFLTRGDVAGGVSNKAASDGNANALDAGLEALVAFLARADEEYASRCARGRAVCLLHKSLR